jgi:DNA-binding transcriptional MerR regulator
MVMNEWPINELARLAGVSSRTLRHYGDVGLLPASRIGSNGYRYYDGSALVRLQRILLLRGLGVGLAAIADILAADNDVDALSHHLGQLQDEKARLDRQIGAVAHTIETLRKGEPLMAEKALDGFDHTRYREEVETRWGAAGYEAGNNWWNSKSTAKRQAWIARQNALAADWMQAAADGRAPDDDDAQQLAQRQFDWLSAVPGIPPLTREYFTGLGELYVADDRFAANYGGVTAAMFVRDAMAAYADRSLPSAP